MAKTNSAISDQNPGGPIKFRPEDFSLSDEPPPILYKYMVAERIGDVLEGGAVRFTHLVNTNDPFEVRKTFKRFAGPKLKEFMMNSIVPNITSEFVDKKLKEQLRKRGINLPLPVFKAVITQNLGMTAEQYMRSQMGGFVEMFLDGLDSVKTPEDFLEEIGSIIMCFSLSERYDIPTMWAHYGGGHSGFVIAFDTSHPWFCDDKKPEKSKLQKIKYIDEQNDELFDDLQAAFSSKATDWAYEREWRMNCSMKQVDKTVDLGTDKIHLRAFPPESVVAVIVGSKALDATVESLRDVLKRKYPHARLQRTTPRRMTGTFELEDI